MRAIHKQALRGIATSHPTPTRESLIQQLEDIKLRRFTKYKKSDAPTRLPSNVDIVSPELCNDVLQYLAPSLEKHKGCDIIDLHPGACLWTQKLHDFLKPRRHLLMEPEEKYYEPFIRPLLDRPNSAFRYTTLSGANPRSYWDSYKQIFDDTLLPRRKALDDNDPAQRRPNNSLLVTGSLARIYKTRKFENHVQNPNMLLNQMAQASQTNQLFHTFGLVRMLFWQPDDDTKANVIAAGAFARGAFNAGLEMAVDVTQVAGVTVQREIGKSLGGYVHKFRDPKLDHQSTARVLQRSESQRFHMPEHRRSEHVAKVMEDSKVQSTTKSKEATGESSPAALTAEQLIAGSNAVQEQLTNYMTKLLETRNQYNRSAAIPYARTISDELPRQWRAIIGKRIPYKDRVGPAVDQHDKQVQLERDFARARPTLSAAECKQVEEHLLASAKVVRVLMPQTLPLVDQSIVHEMLDEEVAMEIGLLAHDRRPYEALETNAAEFWPRYPMMLLDLQPREFNFASDITSAAEGNVVMRDFIKTLYQRPSEAVPLALNRVAYNGEELINSAPSIRDVFNGGRVDPLDVKVKMLTKQMLTELVTAFLEWPFRPTSVELALMSDVSAGTSRPVEAAEEWSEPGALT